MKPYKLMCTLHGHSGDVKGLYPTRDEGGFVSVSRDLTAKMWQCVNTDDKAQYIQTETISSHKKYVNAVTVVYTVKEYPNGIILTGSNDQTILIHEIGSNKTIAELKEHEGAVCTLFNDANSNSNILYSGSFDSSAKIWDLNDLVKSDFKLSSIITIKEHQHTVWCVLAIEKKNILLTASADKTIKQFRINVETKSYEYVCKYAAHSDCVRGLTLNNVNEEKFYSCSNDGSVLEWNLDTLLPIRNIKPTSSFMYSINVMPTYAPGQAECYFVTSGEDRSLRLYSVRAKEKINLVQTLVLPCQTLWNAVCLSNHNIVVACNDGSIRVFTQNEQLFASKPEMDEYEKELAQFAISVKTDQNMAEIRLNDLPGIEALERAGKQDGQSIVVNNNNEAEVYQWDANEMRWIKIGVAVGSSGSGGGGARAKVKFEGAEYDYVFAIELDEHNSKLKLPYNVSEDPWHAAQKFIHKHDLGQQFLDQIAKFIITNTGSETIGDASSTSSYYDPFTGGDRYVPPAGHVSQTNTAAAASNFNDPFTGSNAYRTGGGSAANDPQEKKFKNDTKKASEHFPQSEYMLFDQMNFEPIFKKFKEFHSKLVAQNNAQNDENLSKIEKLIANFQTLKSDDNNYASALEILFEMLNQWPKENKFPIIDLLRVFVLNPVIANYLTETQSLEYLKTKERIPTASAYFKILESQFESKENAINPMLTAKVYCNLFKSLSEANNLKLTAFLMNERPLLFVHLGQNFLSTENKSLQIAMATLLANYMVLIKKLAQQPKQEYFSAENITNLVLENIQYLNSIAVEALNWDSDALLRVLVAFGTLASRTDSLLDYELITTVAKTLEEFKQILTTIKSKSQKYSEKVNECATSLLKLIN